MLNKNLGSTSEHCLSGKGLRWRMAKQQVIGSSRGRIAKVQVTGGHAPSCSLHMIQDSTGLNRLETVDCSSTYLAGPC